MNPAWGPTIVAVIGMLVTLAVTWGMLKQATADLVQKVAEVKVDLNKRIDDNKRDVDEHKASIWPRVGVLDTKVAKIEGRLGINGGGVKGSHQ